jgi:O-acetyl-ADP-ribose deacetylase (regulator of RNase III)
LTDARLGLERSVPGGVLALAIGDITRFPADALVNAANEALVGGSGADGAIHRAGGPEIMAELRRRYPTGTPTGSAVLTGAGRLPARWVVHAVGPVWRGGAAGEPGLLAAAYRQALVQAAAAGARTVALAAISCGIYGYPLDAAARIAIRTVQDGLARHREIERATFVLFSEPTYAAFADALLELPEA